MVKKVELVSYKRPNYYALVDDQDYEFITQWKWNLHKDTSVKWKDRFYAVRKEYVGRVNKKSIEKGFKMHRVILENMLNDEGKFELLKNFKEYPRKYLTDHIDGDGLNNQRDNLRIVTPRENAQNFHKKGSSKYPGVYWNNINNNWTATIHLKEEHKHLGNFSNEEDAYKAYLRACKLVEIGGMKLVNKVFEFKKSSKYKNVSWRKDYNKWIAYLQINGKRKHLGYFNNEYDAHLAVERAKKEIQTNQNS